MSYKKIVVMHAMPTMFVCLQPSLVNEKGFASLGIRVMLMKLGVGLLSMLALLVWVGWRFFVAVPQKNDVTVSDLSPPRVTYLRKIAGFSRAACNLLKSVQWRLNLASLKWLTHWSIWLMPLLAGLPIYAVFALSGQVSLAPLELINFNWQMHIQSALNMEKLAPPPPVPPSLFISAARPELETANRDWNRLDPSFVQLALQVFERMQARGFPLVLLEGYRSPQRQDLLFNAKTHTTNARAYESKHQYGLALDAAPLKDGKLVISEMNPWAMQAYQVLGEEAEKLGLVWGGRWKFQDYGHIESGITVDTDSKK